MGRWAPLQVVKLCSGPLVIALLYLHIAVYEAELNYGVEVQDAPHLLEKRDDLGNGNELSPKRVALLPEKARQGQQWSVRGLFDLGVKDSLALVNLLTEEDPLGVSIEDPEEFKCPQSSQYLVSPPDYSDGGAEATFKAGGGFLYFQHLRKAGGTGFCDLAQRNMPKSEVPDYYCMPDRLGALATPPWSEASYLMGQMTKRGYRIAANEWDAFPASHLQLPGAVFATSIRDPLDRWYSQYRFEHLEHRDGTRWWSYFGRWSFGQWYERIMHDSMGNNYYTKTFCGEENTTDEIAKETMRRKGMWRQLTAKKNFYWTYAKFRPWKAAVEWEQFEAAMETLRHFNMVLILDWMTSSSSEQLIESVLGWQEEARQVLPHERQAPRKRESSKKAVEMLRKEEWETLATDNAFDVLFYHWAKRLYLERHHRCR